MKGIVCGVCGFISLDGIPEVCPVCGAPKEKFSEKDDAYKMPDFKAETGESEKKHIPKITIIPQCGLMGGGSAAHAKIGEIAHPMLPEHHITDIYFYLNKKYLGSVHLSSDASPGGMVNLKEVKEGVISVIEHCNVHGYWYNEVKIQ